MDDPRRIQIANAISAALSPTTPPEIDAIAEAIGAAVASACGGADTDPVQVEDRARRAALGVLKMHLHAPSPARR
jgi:hypothetical protein